MFSNSVTLTILSENTAGQRGLMAEHGLSILVEKGDTKLLFDTGQGLVIEHNAKQLGVRLDDLDLCVISHGHWDHTGGLNYILKENGSLPVVGHPDMFAKRFVKRLDGSVGYVGIQATQAELESMGAVVKLTRNPLEMAEGVMVTGQIPRKVSFELPPPNFAIQKDGKMIQDDFPDDMSLIIQTHKGLIVLLGCCHSGLLNTLDHVFSVVGDQRIYLIIGGTHLVGASEERLNMTINNLHKYDIGYVMPLHCTGFTALTRLHNALGRQFLKGEAGTKIVVE